MGEGLQQEKIKAQRRVGGVPTGWDELKRVSVSR